MNKMDRTGIKWSRDETILAFDLYCRTPFGRIDKSNPDIIKLADMLGRTPSAVGLKMCNLAHFDPELQKRNINAMSHASKLDEDIFTEFSEDWDALSYQAQLIRAQLLHQEIPEIIDIGYMEDAPPGKERDQLIRARVGQNFFRATVLNAYGNRCCITGLACPDLLVASHIKPWRDSDIHTERTNPSNGLCLNPLHDKAFDLGLITLDQSYNIILSRKIKDTHMDSKMMDWFMGYEHHQITLPDKFYPGKEFIEYHNDVIFQK